MLPFKSYFFVYTLSAFCLLCIDGSHAQTADPKGVHINRCSSYPVWVIFFPLLYRSHNSTVCSAVDIFMVESHSVFHKCRFP